MKVISILLLVILIIIIVYLLLWGISICIWLPGYYKKPINPFIKVLDKNDRIPKVLYKKGNSEIPSKEIIELYKKIEKDNPGYKVKYYGNKAARQFIKDNCKKEVLDAYNSLIPDAYKADLFRCILLYVNGGIYGDFSQQYLVPLDSLVNREKDKLVLTLDNPMPIIPFLDQYSYIANGFMAANKNHPFFKQCIEQIVKNVKNKYYGKTIFDPTGPALVQKILNLNPKLKYRMDIALLFHNKSGGSIPYFERLGSHKKVIIHKLPNHYKLLNNKKTGRSYSKLWKNRNIYKKSLNYNNINR